jgi:F-type H+-transporting ATPase subunit gamma
MFARMMRGGAPRAMPHRLGGFGAAMQTQERNAATLKAIAIRMRSVKSIQKITKAMKMVAAAKLRHDQRRMENGLPFTAPVLSLFERLPREEKAGTLTVMAVTSDKGLCGGVNSAVNKLCRAQILDEEAKGNAVNLMAIGGKAVAGMKRLYGDRFTSTFEGVTKVAWSYTTASIIAERLIAANPYRLKVANNTYKSMVSYDTRANHTITKLEAQGIDRAEFSKAMDVYSFEPALYEIWDDLHEFYYGAVIYNAYLNSATAEQSARMTAMENASKNAGEMLEKLSLIYNRARQAKITTELCEIISGASAV